MSIVTGLGDQGQTSLIGGDRVSKADARVEATGEVDELIATMGLARSLCENPEVQDLTKSIQRELFRVSSALGAPGRPETEVTDAMVDALTDHARRIESIEGLLSDWSLPGEDAAAAAYDLARTVCRRTERHAVAMIDSGSPVEPNAVRYLNRLSDLLWLFARQIELEIGANSALRKDPKDRRWSRAW
ncbi:MAG TPA: cob(I)yrinic acid a,c-diamide adenosyltransferase [Terriglobia bacterium]|nr:cob(I)yrinic acid a,c-diamide adenosyltransferase [Terriglobia bacterium]